MELNIVVCISPSQYSETNSSSRMVFATPIKKSWTMLCHHNENHLEEAATTSLEVNKS